MVILSRTQARGYVPVPLAFSDAGAVPDWALPHVEVLAAQGGARQRAAKPSAPAISSPGARWQSCSTPCCKRLCTNPIA